MDTYKIVGPLPVVGHEPGDTVSDDDLVGLNVTHLIEVGHLAVVPKKAGKAEPAPPPPED